MSCVAQTEPLWIGIHEEEENLRILELSNILLSIYGVQE